jgi:hypothetical protein
MIRFVIWLSINGHWFIGPDFDSQKPCDALVKVIKQNTTGVDAVCSPRGMP